MPHQVRHQLVHVGLGAMDEARLAAAQERQAEHVQPGASTMPRSWRRCPAVEDRHVEPA
jgi:hypothetical protein